MEQNQEQSAQVIPQQPTVNHIRPKRRFGGTFLILTLVLLLAASGALGYLYYKANNKEKKLLDSNAALQADISGLNGIVDALVA